jgi:hypothetical protein
MRFSTLLSCDSYILQTENEESRGKKNYVLMLLTVKPVGRNMMEHKRQKKNKRRRKKLK